MGKYGEKLEPAAQFLKRSNNKVVLNLISPATESGFNIFQGFHVFQKICRSGENFRVFENGL